MATVNGKQAIHLCSNDYLGLSQNKRVVEKTTRALRQVSQCSSRLIAGNDPAILELEALLASHRKTESALVYPTGYAANLGVITALADKNTAIFSDELNHASIIDACRLSGATVKIFKHNDSDHLENLLTQSSGRKIIVTEGVFSMDGDSANLREISKATEKHDAITVVDDAHGDFVMGPEFSGAPADAGVNVDVHISSMSKGLGCFGGYVAASDKIRELLINTSRQFIYTSALPDHLCVSAIAAIPIAKKGHLQKKLYRNISHFKKNMTGLGFSLGNSSSQIIPILVGDEKKSVLLSQTLLEEGVFAQAVRYPTVKKGSARLRVSLTAMHTLKHIDIALSCFEQAGKKLQII
ncbi:MAG: 8-amino-7-oxononanoate synthase [Nitrososphaera sp.]|nr:8-amino-7-oxononanoate synthase [Nitrososphaera sp.]